MRATTHLKGESFNIFLWISEVVVEIHGAKLQTISGINKQNRQNMLQNIK